MAYQVRSRDPFFASDTQELIERRGREMIGLAFLAVGIALAMLLVSYSPEDPGWLAATDGPVHNYLGRVGAAIASPMMVIIGLASWGFSIALVVWGIRFVSHKGAGRLLGRAFLVPIAIAIATVYTSTLLPGPRWTHSFGMGGLFGDTIAGAVLGLSPFSMIVSLKVLSVVSGLATLAVGLFALGFDAGELRRVGRFLMVGVVMIYALFASLLGLGARKAASGAAQAAKGAVRGAVRGAAHGAMGAARSAARIRLRQSADAPVGSTPTWPRNFPRHRRWRLAVCCAPTRCPMNWSRNMPMIRWTATPKSRRSGWAFSRGCRGSENAMPCRALTLSSRCRIWRKSPTTCRKRTGFAPRSRWR